MTGENQERKTIVLGDLKGVEVLREDIFAYMKPSGNSMTPIIHSKDKILIENRDWVREAYGRYDYRVGDAVYCKVKGRYYVHLIKAIKKDGDSLFYQIGNNKGRINGWTNESNVFGVVIEVNGKLII